MMEDRKSNIAFLFVPLAFILYVTILSRVPTLTRTVHLKPLWSYLSSGHWKQIILNIALFFPLGFFLAAIFSETKHPHFWTIITALAISVGIELIQFFTYRGVLDVDDLISNACGAAIGLLIWRTVGAGWRKKTAWIMLTAGLIGCIMTGFSAAKSSIDVRVTKQFQFSLSAVSTYDGKTVIEGECYLYDRATPAYTILIDGKEAATTVDGQKFRTEVPSVDHKAEVEIRFKGFLVMPTGTWINGDKVEYVSGIEPIIRGIHETSVLKAWNTEHDVLVYQDGDRLLWLIGTPIDRNTEVIFHIHTTEPEKLPEYRIQYGFDNRGFRVKADEKAVNELDSTDHYRVFQEEIPSEYNVTAVAVGFNTDGTVTWNDSFRIE